MYIDEFDVIAKPEGVGAARFASEKDDTALPEISDEVWNETEFEENDIEESDEIIKILSLPENAAALFELISYSFKHI